ncbi:MAG: ferrous iron transport protein B [Synechococcaceae cyanobacterium]|nr:ferrous iron transport protein B [Synechococcaceae cyanobacterium]
MTNRSLEASSCHGLRSPAARSGAVTVALVGMPNTGKSTLFNRLTGGDAQIANWPGLTVDLLRGRLPDGPDGRPWELVDLPGIHDLAGGSEDEAIVLRFLSQTPPQGVVVVLNASHITSQLRLLLELRQLNLPLLLALNMSDEAERFGIRIDAQELSRRLGVPVLAISARQRLGLGDLQRLMRQRFDPAFTPQNPAMAGPEALPERPTPAPGSPTELHSLLQGCVQLPEQPRNLHSRRVDRWLLHPLVGPLVFLLIVLLMFQAIYALGAPVQEAFGYGFDAVRNGLLTPLLQLLPLPALLRSFLLDGVWLGLSTVVSFLPIIFLFYLVMAIVEDSGYLPRAAFLMDGFMHWLGLDGRAFVLQVMGFGCNVPAIMGTRVIRDRSMRLLAMLVIPFALCQARLTVFIFLAAVFFPRPWWAPGLVVFSFYLLSFAAAIITGLIFKRAYPSREAFVMELPPYRRPSLGTMLRRARQEVMNFLRTTRTFIILGASLVWLLTHLPPGSGAGGGESIAAWIGGWFQPLLGPIGMSPDLTVALFFGFIAKEILLGAMAVIYRTSETGLGPVMQAAITPLQALSFMTFTLLYTPCLSTVAVQIREARSRGFALRSIAWSLSLAWLAAFTVYQVGVRLT